MFVRNMSLGPRNYTRCGCGEVGLIGDHHTGYLLHRVLMTQAHTQLTQGVHSTQGLTCSWADCVRSALLFMAFTQKYWGSEKVGALFFGPQH
jgi:hypothetical protein